MAADRVIDELVCSAPTYKISNCVSKLWPLGLTCCCWWDYYYDNYYCWYYSYYLLSGLLANLCILALLLEIWALTLCQLNASLVLIFSLHWQDILQVSQAWDGIYWVQFFWAWSATSWNLMSKPLGGVLFISVTVTKPCLHPHCWWARDCNSE